jgi:hypothetical protein
MKIVVKSQFLILWFELGSFQFERATTKNSKNYT